MTNARARLILILFLAVAPLVSALPAGAQEPSAEPPRIGLDASFGSFVGPSVAVRASAARWAVVVRRTQMRDTSGRMVRGGGEVLDPFEAVDETSALVERALWLSPGHLLTVAAGVSRWSGEETTGESRRECSVSIIFGEVCNTWYEVRTNEPTWGPTAEAHFHFVLSRGWRLAPSRIVVGGRVGPNSSTNGLTFGVGYGGAGR